MSKADTLFINMCKDIIENGYSSEAYQVRPKWDDGMPAHTIKQFGVVNRYNLQEEFPAMTLRKTYIKSAVDEVLWIWQKKSNNIEDLNSHIWDEWADENGSIGTAYGYQQKQVHLYRGVNKEGLRRAFPDLTIEGGTFISGEQIIASEYDSDSFLMTQLDKAIYDLVNNPLSRRILVTMWNPDDLHNMRLEPCAYSMTFNVTGDRLNAVLNQRSQDILTANNWNVVQYAVLMHMIARHCGLVPGEMVHVIADAHIYDRHVPIVEELIKREPFPAPQFRLSADKKNFYEFNTDDIKITGYKTHPQVTNIPVAV